LAAVAGDVIGDATALCAAGDVIGDATGFFAPVSLFEWRLPSVRSTLEHSLTMADDVPSLMALPPAT
jgi:hypothetical protein